MSQAIVLEENDPELFKVLGGGALAPEVEMALMDGTWPDEADPALTAAAKQKAAEEKFRADLQQMEERTKAMSEARVAGRTSAADLDAIEASRQRGVEFARAAAGRRW